MDSLLIFRVLGSELDIHPYSWDVWIRAGSPALFLMCLGPELGPLPHLQGIGAYTEVGSPIHFWSVGLRAGSPPSFSGNLGQDPVLLSPLIFLLLLGVPNL